MWVSAPAHSQEMPEAEGTDFSDLSNSPLLECSGVLPSWPSRNWLPGFQMWGAAGQLGPQGSLRLQPFLELFDLLSSLRANVCCFKVSYVLVKEKKKRKSHKAEVWDVQGVYNATTQITKSRILDSLVTLNTRRVFWPLCPRTVSVHVSLQALVASRVVQSPLLSTPLMDSSPKVNLLVSPAEGYGCPSAFPLPSQPCP